MKKISFIGAGRMAEALISGLLSKETLGPTDIIAADVDDNRLKLISKRYAIETTTDNTHAVQMGEFVLLAVKPQQLDEVVVGLKSSLSSEKTIISIVAGVATSRICELAGSNIPVVRVMPNAPALANAGISAIALPPKITDETKVFIAKLFRSAGEIIYVNETDIDAVTAVSGSGPAYFYLFIKELAEAGAKIGLDYEVALTLARQTFFGSASLMSETGRDEDDLINSVASPGGTTEAALAAFSAADLGNVIQAAVTAAWARAKELART